MRIRQCCKGLVGKLNIPGDKSISHRAVMIGSLAEGVTEVRGFLAGQDCLATIECFRQLGVIIEQTGTAVTVHGVGLGGLKPPQQELYVGNSGTTIRLMLGILAGQSFPARITGDMTILRRPMQRIIEPLSLMGANIELQNGLAPVHIHPVKQLHGINYVMPIASAQVKSAIMLAALYAQGKTTITEPQISRNHSEIMLNHFGAQIKREAQTITISSPTELQGKNVCIPGDISAAAFLMVAALIVPGSNITITNVGVNPTRTGIIDVLQAMGGQIQVELRHSEAEPVADIHVRYSTLRGTAISGEIIPRLIDELPIIAVAAAVARGETKIRDAEELRVKESDRIAAIVQGLRKFGVNITEYDDGMDIQGGCRLQGAIVASEFDHRLAMAFAVLGLAAEGETVVTQDECVSVSFPEFKQKLRRLGAPVCD